MQFALAPLLLDPLATLVPLEAVLAALLVEAAPPVPELADVPIPVLDAPEP